MRVLHGFEIKWKLIVIGKGTKLINGLIFKFLLQWGTHIFICILGETCLLVIHLRMVLRILVTCITSLPTIYQVPQFSNDTFVVGKLEQLMKVTYITLVFGWNRTKIYSGQSSLTKNECSIKRYGLVFRGLSVLLEIRASIDTGEIILIIISE